MNVSKFIEMGQANQSVAMQVQKKLHNTNNVLYTDVRVDADNDHIIVMSQDTLGNRREHSAIIVQENGNQIFTGDFQQLKQILMENQHNQNISVLE